MLKTPLYEQHIGLNGHMHPFAGYLMPTYYTSIIAEHKAVRQSVGLFDVSHMGNILIKGDAAADFLQFVCSNDLRRLSVGQCQYTCLPNLQGGIIDDAVLYHLTRDEFMLVVNALTFEKDWQWLCEQNKNYNAILKNVCANYAILALQGPKSIDVLQPLTDDDLSVLEPFCFVKTTVARIPNVIVSRTGYTGAGGFELYVTSQNAPSLWDTLLNHKHHTEQINPTIPCGLGARDTLRLEMGYCLYGQDIDDTTSPFEAGLGWITKLNKVFINRDYFKNQKEKGLNKKLVGMVMQSPFIPRNSYPILNKEGLKIGLVTSGTLSPMLEKGIALGYVASAYSTEGTPVYIQSRQNTAKAIVKTPPLWTNQKKGSV